MRKTALLSLILFAAACGGGADTLDDSPGVTGQAPPAAVAAPGPASGTTRTQDRTPVDAGGSAVPETATQTATDRRNIVFIGTSLTAGYGVGEERGYPAVIQARIDSAGLPFRVVNAGVSGETSAGGLARLDWVLRTPVDVLVLELGANDGLRGLPIPQLRANLDSILVRTHRAYPAAALVIVGMEAPPNLGTEYTTAFHNTFTELAALRGATLVPFLLDGVAGIPALNQADGIHPTVEGHRILARNVWRVLGPLLVERERTEDRGRS